MKSKIKSFAAVLLVIVFSGCSALTESQTAQVRLSVLAPQVECVNVPVSAIIDLPEQLAQVPAEQISVVLKEQGKAGPALPGQVVADPDGRTRLWWILPRAKAGSTTTWTATLKRSAKTPRKTFSWSDEPGEYLDLLFDGRKVTRYIYAYDNSTAEGIRRTYKPFHHIFDAEGQNLLTNGPDGVGPYEPSLYPHHRG